MAQPSIMKIVDFTKAGRVCRDQPRAGHEPLRARFEEKARLRD